MENQMKRIESKQSVLQSKTSRLCFRIFIVGLLMLSSSVSLVQTAICPSSVPSSAKSATEECNFIGESAYTVGVVGGPVSNSLYYLIYLYPSISAIIRKVDATGSQSWLVSSLFHPIQKSLSVDATEQNVYLASQSYPLVVLKLLASNASIVSQQAL